ncbi:Ubiquitin carboxyl-terminal hydrolase 2 [Hypsibius exemplaris]|uniref:Ubiquitin carboxyl-terminal hydrolase n=1 Tax=Hypsibius exemplaris TaxID=2072580 RepID=A0A1W0WDS4_HYPEX|nr:Ubiquitin carboxyl-terminal hydrolase 2 [Hypsibius exemplaris]
MTSTATLGLSSSYYGGRSRSRLTSSDSSSTPSRGSYIPATLPRTASAAASGSSSNPIVQYTKDLERIRSERSSRANDTPINTSGGTTGSSFGGSNSSLDRVGLSSPKSPGPSYSTTGTLRTRPAYSETTTTATPVKGAGTSASTMRNSILDPSAVLKPVISSPYVRTRTPSASESVYDYHTSRSSSLIRRRPAPATGSRDVSIDRSKVAVLERASFREKKASMAWLLCFSSPSSDLRNRNGRRVPNGDSDVDDEVSVGSNTTTYRQSALPPHATSPLLHYSSQQQRNHPSSGIPTSSSRQELSYGGSPKSGSLQRYDSTSSLRSGRFTPTSANTTFTSTGMGMPNSASSGTLQRYGSSSSLSGGQRFNSRRSSRGDLSVNFDLSQLDTGKERQRSPIVLVSRVAVEKELPAAATAKTDVESRYVVGKFSTVSDGNVRNVPIQIEPRERSASRDRSVSTVPVSRTREPVKVSTVMASNGAGYGRKQSGERVVGGKQFQSDSSLGDSSSSSDEDDIGTKHTNSIIRAASPPSARRPTGLMARKANVSVDESDKAGLIGLKNLGNTCFMNSILQCLSNTRPLRDYCLLGEYESEVNTTTSQMKGALITTFASMMEALWKRHTSYSASSPYIPDKFHRQVQQYAPRFSGYLQQDAQEFLRYLLEGLHEDVNRVTEKTRPESADIPHSLSDAQKATESWKRYLRRDNSKIVDLFVGQLKSSLICESCGYCSVTCDPFWDLSLPIPGSRGGRRSDPTVTTNLAECFKLFTKEEMLEGDECPTCCHCKTRQKCRKFFSIQRFPKYFVIHLKRFSQERFRAKLSTLVEYPVEHLDLSPFAAESYQGPHPLYNLYAVSCHSGSTHCGHYTGFCKHPVSGKWNEYNDARVTSARMADVVTSEAYVLFYELVS